MPNKKPANKISKGRTPKPAVNNIKDVDKSRVIGKLKNMQKRIAVVRNRLPVGPNANNAVASRGRMGGPVAGAFLAAATPSVRKLGTAMGTKLIRSEAYSALNAIML